MTILGKFFEELIADPEIRTLPIDWRAVEIVFYAVDWDTLPAVMQRDVPRRKRCRALIPLLRPFDPDGTLH
jgi:hypothetical protein